MLGPRLGRWDIEGAPPMGSPTNALVGLFMLWWGWLAFNSGSTFGVTGNKWRLAARVLIPPPKLCASGMSPYRVDNTLHKVHIDV